jgi:DNA-binding MarR family transcriptional regulator
VDQPRARGYSDVMSQTEVRDADYRRLAQFRRELRYFLKFSEAAARKAGLTPQQHQVLLAIRAGPDRGMSVGDLAQQMLLRPHSATGLVDRLAEAGLVERVRDDEDRRQVRVRATGTAHALLASLSDSHRTELRRLKPLLTELIEAL